MSAMLKLSFVCSVLSVALFVCFTMSTEAREVQNEEGRVNDSKWCIAKPSTADTELDMNIKYVCESQTYHPIDCAVIKPGGSCYNPSNKVSSAAMVMNLYFQADGQSANACNFYSSGMVVYENPTVGSCIYPPA